MTALNPATGDDRFSFTPFTRHPFFTEVNRWILAQPQAGTVDAAVDAYPLLSCGDPDVLCPRFTAPFNDGLHFGSEGHERLGEQLFSQVFADCA